MFLFKKIALAICLFVSLPNLAFATSTYTSLISSSDFDGVTADVTTAAVAIIAIMIIPVGAGLLIRTFTK